MDTISMQPVNLGNASVPGLIQPKSLITNSTSSNIIPVLANQQTPTTADKPSDLVDTNFSSEDANKLISQLERQLSSLGMSVRFGVDEASNRNYFAIEDSLSGDLVRQIPSEEMLSISRNLQQFLESNLYARVGQTEDGFAPGIITDQQA